MPKYCIHSGPVFLDRLSPTVVLETAQLVLSQFKNI